MQILLYHHEVFSRHDTGSGHPERPARLEAAVAGVRGSGATVIEREPPEIDEALLCEIHDREYVTNVRRFCEQGGGYLDHDTVTSFDSWEAALRSAGAGPAAVEDLRKNSGDAAFLAVRPPGHHALTAKAMGFCVFNNIAITAAALVAQGERVAILDWDVHHGNGTQETFYESGDVVYISMHEYPFYPGTGWVDEDGDQDGSGHIINVPFPAGTSGDAYEAACERIVGPVLSAFDPSWLLVSAGYDAHVSDPLADLRLRADDYGRMAAFVAAAIGTGRVLLFLEGGYDLAAIESSVAASVQGLAGDAPEGLSADRSPERAHRIVDLVAARVADRWEPG